MHCRVPDLQVGNAVGKKYRKTDVTLFKEKKKPDESLLNDWHFVLIAIFSLFSNHCRPASHHYFNQEMNKDVV